MRELIGRETVCCKAVQITMSTDVYIQTNNFVIRVGDIEDQENIIIHSYDRPTKNKLVSFFTIIAIYIGLFFL